MDKRSLCLCFLVHQPIRLRQYRFFDIAKNHDYYDDFANKTFARHIADSCYLPMNCILLDLIKRYGKNFKISFSITGMALEQFQRYTPDVIDSFKELVQTGCVELLAETYSNSFGCLVDESEFKKQVKRHADLIKGLFGGKLETFKNTELVYSDEIGEMVANMGYKTMLTEGARHILGWKSPNYVYTNSINPRLKVLLRNFRLNDDIVLRFSDGNWDQYPMNADKYASWLNVTDGEVVNLFMDYKTFGEYHKDYTGIFDFMAALPEQVFKNTNYEFLFPKEIAKKHQPIAPLHVPYPISGVDEERDLTAWTGNELQKEAFVELYKLRDSVYATKDEALIADFYNLQASENFYYMDTKLFLEKSVHLYLNPYSSPYDAFINYMNVLSDFVLRVETYKKEKKKEK